MNQDVQEIRLALLVPLAEGGIANEIKKIKAGGFGCLTGWQSPHLDPNLVVFYGRSESDKSTLFNFDCHFILRLAPCLEKQQSLRALGRHAGGN